MKLSGYYKFSVFWVVGLFFLVGCGPREKEEDRTQVFKEAPRIENPDNILASVDGSQITAQKFVDLIRIKDPNLNELSTIEVTKNETGWITSDIESYFMGEVMASSAEKMNLREDIAFRDWRREAEKNLLINMYFEKEVSGKVKITRSDIESFYEKNLNRFTVPLTYYIRHIFFSKDKWGETQARARADAAYEKLEAGTSFREVTLQYSDSDRTFIDKDFGPYHRGEINPYLETAALSLKLGEFSKPVQTDKGYNIVQLARFNEEKVSPLSEAEHDIESYLYQLQQQKIYKNLIDNLAKMTKSKIHFDYLDNNQYENMDSTLRILEVGESYKDDLGYYLTISDFMRIVKKNGWTKKEEKLNYLQDIYDKTLLYIGADHSGIRESESFKMTLSELDRQSLAILYENETIDKKISPSEEDLKAYYEKYPGKFYIPQMVNAYNILIKFVFRSDMFEYERIKEIQRVRGKIEAVRNEISNGLTFREAAALFSEAENASMGGLIGWTKPGGSARFDRAAFALEEWEVSKPVEMKDGFMLIWVTDINEPRPISYDEAKKMVENHYREDFAYQGRKELRNKIREEIKIEYHNDEILKLAEHLKQLKHYLRYHPNLFHPAS